MLEVDVDRFHHISGPLSQDSLACLCQIQRHSVFRYKTENIYMLLPV
jgi:hypothetical protein